MNHFNKVTLKYMLFLNETEDVGVNGRYMYLETPSFKITKLRIRTAKNAAISANFKVWNFCEKAQFPNCFSIVLFHKISIARN